MDVEGGQVMDDVFDESEDIRDPQVRDALSALDDRAFRTGEPADGTALARIAVKLRLDPEQVAIVRRIGRELGLVASDSPLERRVDLPKAGGEEDAPSASGYATEWQSLRELFQAARRYPLLSAQDEKNLARRYLLGQQAQEALRTRNGLSAAVRRDLAAQVEDGRLAKDTFILSNLRLVASIARWHRHQGLEVPDLVQEGIVGLIRAVEKFDHTLDYKLSTYATWWIRQSIARAIADKGRTIRLPVHVHEKVRRILATERRLWWELEREPTIHDIAARLGEDPADVAYVKQAAESVVSLDAQVRRGDEDSAELVDLIAVTEPSVEAIVMARAQADELGAFLDELHPRERDVVKRRYGIGTDVPETLQQIAESMGITRERVRQIQDAALKQLLIAHPTWSPAESEALAVSGRDEAAPDPVAGPVVNGAGDRAVPTEKFASPDELRDMAGVADLVGADAERLARLAPLTPDERTLMVRRFGIGRESMSLAQVCAELDIDWRTAQALELSALRKLRGPKEPAA